MKKLIFTLLLLLLDASTKIFVPNAMNNKQEANHTVLCHSDSEDEIEENNQRLNFFSEVKADQDVVENTMNIDNIFRAAENMINSLPISDELRENLLIGDQKFRTDSKFCNYLSTFTLKEELKVSMQSVYMNIGLDVVSAEKLANTYCGISNVMETSTNQVNETFLADKNEFMIESQNENLYRYLPLDSNIDEQFVTKPMQCDEIKVINQAENTDKMVVQQPVKDGIRNIEFGKNFTFCIGEEVLARDNTDADWNQGTIVEITPEVLVQRIDANEVIGFPWQYIKKIKVCESTIKNAESSDSEEIEEKDFTQLNQIALKQEFKSPNFTNRPAIHQKHHQDVLNDKYIDLFHEEINGIDQTNNTFEANKIFTDLESQFQRRNESFHLSLDKEYQSGKKEKKNLRNISHSMEAFSSEDREEKESDDEPIKKMTKQIEELEKANFLKRELIEEIKEAKNLKRKRVNKSQKKILKKIADYSTVSPSNTKEKIEKKNYGEKLEHVKQEFNRRSSNSKPKFEPTIQTQTGNNNNNSNVDEITIKKPSKMISVLKQLPEEGDDVEIVKSFTSQNGIDLHQGDTIHIVTGFIESYFWGQVKSTENYVHILKVDYNKLITIDKNVCDYCKQQTVRDYLLASKRSNYMLCATCWQYEYRNKKLIPRNERVSQPKLNNENKKSSLSGIYSASSKYSNIYFCNQKKKYQCIASIKVSGSKKFRWRRICADINEDYCAKRAIEIVKGRMENKEYQSVRNGQKFATLKPKKVTICEYCKRPSSTQRLIFSTKSKLKLCNACDRYERKYNRLLRYKL